MRNVRRLTTLALLVALDIVFTRFLSVMLPGGLDRLSLQFLPHALAGLLFGPLGAMAACVAGDLLGMTVNSAGLAFTPLLTLSAAVRGLLYGLLLYQKPLTLRRCLLACGLVTLVVDLGLNPVWMRFLYGQAYLVILLAKIPVRLVWAPVCGLVLFLAGRALQAARVVPASDRRLPPVG